MSTQAYEGNCIAQIEQTVDAAMVAAKRQEDRQEKFDRLHDARTVAAYGVVGAVKSVLKADLDKKYLIETFNRYEAAEKELDDFQNSAEWKA